MIQGVIEKEVDGVKVKLLAIQETKKVWVAWTNTDLTEGRGFQKALAVCAKKATAIRLGEKRYVMGSDCPVSEGFAMKVGGSWLVPGTIESPTPVDDNEQKAIDEREKVLEKAKASGLTDEDIKALRS